MYFNLKEKIKKIMCQLGLWDSYQLFRIKRNLKKNGIKYCNRQLFTDYNSKVLFIHIPKAAGMSVVNSLYKQNRSHHASALDYLNEDRDKFHSAFSFAITRNPYTRLYSAYYYLKNGGMNIIDRAWWDIYLSKYKNFEIFITEGGLEYAIKEKAEHFIPQYKFIYGDNDELLCNYFGKIEKIEDVEFYISEKLQKKIKFSKKNVVNKTEAVISDIYTDDMLSIVNRCYEKDFSLLGYEKS